MSKALEVYKFLKEHATYKLNNFKIVKNQCLNPASIIVRNKEEEIVGVCLWSWKSNAEVEITDLVVHPSYRDKMGKMARNIAEIGVRKFPEVETLYFERHRRNGCGKTLHKMNLRRIANGANEKLIDAVV